MKNLLHQSWCHKLGVILLLLSLAGVHGRTIEPRARCTVAANEDGSDDTPAIIEAFKSCRTHGRIVFANTTYYINSVLNTTDLLETDIYIYGTLLWSDDLDYWLDNPQHTGFQNGSAAWFLGGTNVTINGFGYGTLDGNGQAWYDLVQGESNYPNRPHNVALWKANNFVIQNLRFVQSQMWTVAIMHSETVVFDGVYIRSESDSSAPARNTDGVDTIDSSNLTFRNMYIRNGDDAIAIKGNSTNILVEDSTFDNSLGLAFGSLGQYDHTKEVVENVLARNIFFNGTLHASYIKTWTGDVINYPPNGGGGGTGYLRNISECSVKCEPQALGRRTRAKLGTALQDFTFIELRSSPFSITQCTTFSGGDPDCDSSLFKISDISMSNWTGDTSSTKVLSLDCSESSGGCTNISIEDFDITNTDDGDEVDGYSCDNVSDTTGFDC